MKKLLYPLFALFLALPTQSFGVFDIIDPCNQACPIGQTMNPLTCTCVNSTIGMECSFLPVECPSYTKDTSTCTQALCNSCYGTSTRSNSFYGYTETLKSSIKYLCNSSTSRFSCSCGTTVTARECSPGFYGTASTIVDSGCTKCPDNATCAGGNGSTFICNSGYMRNTLGTACIKCPDNGTCTSGILTCNTGYYKTFDSCLRCPQHDDNNKTYGTTNGNATSQTSCYLPKNSTLYDTKGTYKLNADCKYQRDAIQL